MSILNRAYEISVWQEKISSTSGRLEEEKLGVIGSSEMISQSRALEPSLTKNINGSKKFTFKMYRYYVDNITGEKVENPFIFNNWMISERKVKLKYGKNKDNTDKWYDFIIKDIQEDSSNYLYTYSLEEANVQELAKNGFGVTFDTQLANNLGTAEELATRTLEDTDWTVKSDVFVQTIEESLVYLKVSKGFTAKRLSDPVQNANGWFGGVTESSVSIGRGANVLAFYSCCIDKPYRFQFIILPAEPTLDERGYINNENCQYYVDNSVYDDNADGNGMFLPEYFEASTGSQGTDNGQLISNLYRGKRYGFSQQAKFVPVLNRYVKLYNKYENNEPVKDDKGNLVCYYGYEETHYASPILTTNLISNSTFESTSGWTGSTYTPKGEKATVEAVYGRFEKGEFISAIEDIEDANYSSQIKNGSYKPYLKLYFPSDNSVVLNSGPYDNRVLIGNMIKGIDKYAFYAKVLDSTGQEENSLCFYLQECKYNTNEMCYKRWENRKLVFQNFTNDDYDGDGEDFSNLDYVEEDQRFNSGKYFVRKVLYPNKEEIGYSEAEFKKNSCLRLCVKGRAGTTYYIEEIELIKAVYNSDGVIVPLQETYKDKNSSTWIDGVSLDTRVMDKSFYFFPEDALKDVQSADDLKGYEKLKKENYKIFKPVYNVGAEKVNTIKIKESNYFNILQNIAQTFGGWVDIVIQHESDGRIKSKEVHLKNYVGKENYAGFHYGVNLSKVQRTYASKNIVTKLMVKQNSNEHAEGGFCSIAKAGMNPTGDTSIYDFQYYHKMGLLDAKAYLENEYTKDGYFPTIREYNKSLKEKNNILQQLNQDLTRYKANKEVAETGLAAAKQGLEEVSSQFEALTGFNITQTAEIEKIELSEVTAGAGGISHIYSDISVSVSAFVGISEEIDGEPKITHYECTTTVTVNETSSSDRVFYIEAFPKITLKSAQGSTEKVVLVQKMAIKCRVPADQSSGTTTNRFYAIDTEREDVKKLQTQYIEFLIKEKDFSDRLETINANIAEVENQYEKLLEDISDIKENISGINEAFFSRYRTFIQEGTWISEEYTDDNKYYADALAVMYNSCYPQVSYQLNVVALLGAEDPTGLDLDVYNDFKIEVGDKTYVEDPEFFGDKKEQVAITETIEVFEDPSKDKIKVQNFKTQIQDLFQKITATVQQAEYNAGAYQKAVALAEANIERKGQFMADALNAATTRLTTAGQQSVTWGNDGITVKSVDSPCDAIRMVGGAILLSKQDKNGEQKWVTGVTSDGVSASVITGGTLNASLINIMSGEEPVFRWDEHGITAYDYLNYSSEDVGEVVSGVNTRKFVRFDKNGIYGINREFIDGAVWVPDSVEDITNLSTFALTWDGFKVTNHNNISMRIGDCAKADTDETSLLLVTDEWGNHLVEIDEHGALIWSSGDSPIRQLWCYSEEEPELPQGDYSEYPPTAGEVSDNDEKNKFKWHQDLSLIDNYSAFSDNYGRPGSWKGPYPIYGRNAYSLSLDGDSDTVVYTSDNKLVSIILPRVTITCLAGSNPVEGNITVQPPGDWGGDSEWISNWKEGEHYSLVNSEENYYEKIFTILKIPNDFKEGYFTFIWAKDEIVYAKKMFSLRKIISNADYDFVIPKAVINTSNGDGIFELSVLEKTIDGIRMLEEPKDTRLQIYKTLSGVETEVEVVEVLDEDGQPIMDEDGNVIKKWELQRYEKNQVADILYKLIMPKNDETGQDEIVWDEEVVEFVKNGDVGEPAKVLSLDNDSDTVVYTNDGRLVSISLPKVNLTKHNGASEDTTGYISVSINGAKAKNVILPPTEPAPVSDSEDGPEGSPETDLETEGKNTPETEAAHDYEYYQFTGGDSNETSAAFFQIKKLPDDFEEGEYTFYWASEKVPEDENANYSGILYDRKVFTVKRVTGLADYDLIIPKPVVNSANITDDSTFSIAVKKKGVKGTTILTDASQVTSMVAGKPVEEIIICYQQTPESYGGLVSLYEKISDWGQVNYSKLQSDGMSLVILSGNAILADKATYTPSTFAIGERAGADSGGEDATNEEGGETENPPDQRFEVLDYLLTNPDEVLLWDEEAIEFVDNGLRGDTTYTIMLDDVYVPVTASPYGNVGEEDNPWTHQGSIEVVYGIEGRVLKKEGDSIRCYSGETAIGTIETDVTNELVNLKWTGEDNLVTGFELSLDDEASNILENTVIRFKLVSGQRTLAKTSLAIAVQKQGMTGDPGPQGPSAYTLSLDNDFDLLVCSQETGLPIREDGKPITEVSVTRHIGADASSIGTIECQAPSGWYERKEDEGGNLTGHYLFAIDSSGIGILEIWDVPESFKDSPSAGTKFVFCWKEITEGENSVYDIATFTIKKFVYTVDYDFVLEQTLFNNTNTTDGVVPVKVLKKEGADVTTLNEPPNGLVLQRLDGSDWVDVSDWREGITYNHMSSSIKIRIKSEIDGEEVVWDEETIEFVKDGEAYRISLDEDFITIPATNFGDIEEGSLTVIPTAYLGLQQLGWKIRDSENEENNKELNIEVSSNDGLNITPSEGSFTISWDKNGFEANRVIATFILYNGNTEVDRTIFEAVKQKGSMGAIQCYIHSSAGTIFDEAATGSTVLTAKIFEGATEIDEYGETLDYTWYLDDATTDWDEYNGTTKQTEVQFSILKGHSVHFTAIKKTQS